MPSSPGVRPTSFLSDGSPRVFGEAFGAREGKRPGQYTEAGQVDAERAGQARPTAQRSGLPSARVTSVVWLIALQAFQDTGTGASRSLSLWQDLFTCHGEDMDISLTLDELDSIADAFEMALEFLSLDIAVIDSSDTTMLRNIVVFMAKHHRRALQNLDGDDAIVIAHDATRLFRVVQIRR